MNSISSISEIKMKKKLLIYILNNVLIAMQKSFFLSYTNLRIEAVLST